MGASRPVTTWEMAKGTSRLNRLSQQKAKVSAIELLLRLLQLWNEP